MATRTRGNRVAVATETMSPARAVVNADVQEKIERERQRKADSDARLAARQRAETILSTASVQWRKHQSDTTYDADMVEAVASCIDLGSARKRIAEIVTGSEVAYRGAVARLVMMARWHQGRLRKGEQPLTTDIVISGHNFREPVAALRAKLTTFTDVFNKFSAGHRPKQAARVAAAAQDPIVAARALLRRATIVVGKNGGTQRVPINKNEGAFLSLMIVMLEDPIAPDALGGQRRVSAWLNVLRENVQGR